MFWKHARQPFSRELASAVRMLEDENDNVYYITKNFFAGTCRFFQHALSIFNMPDFTSACRFLSVAVSICRIFFQHAGFSSTIFF
jgi:hypothetical protein